MDGIILAGGQSRRMGREKAAIVIGGSTLLERAVAVLRAAGAERIVIVGLAPTSALAGHRWPSDVTVIADSVAHLGPLRAVIDGIAALGPTPASFDPNDGGICVVMACDHPEPDPHELAMLAARLADGPAETLAALPIVEGRAQPLHAAYRRTTAEPLQKCFERGERSIARALDGLHAFDPRLVLTIERGEGISARSYIDLDDPTELDNYLAESGEPAFGAGSFDGTSG